MTGESELQTYLREFRGIRRLADKAIAQVEDEAFFAGFNDTDNSIAIVVKHLAGNMRSRWTDFLTADGEKPDRHRDTEFLSTDQDTRAFLTERLAAGWDLLMATLESLSLADLERTVTIRGEPLLVRQAIARQLSHYSYHVGQVVLLAKQHSRGSWDSLSIPRGHSTEFNQDPKKYLSR